MLIRLRFLAQYLAFWLLFFIALRAVFLLAAADQALALPGWTLPAIFVHGVRLDVSATAYLTFPVVLLLALSGVPSLARGARLVLPWTLLAILVLALLAAADLGVYRGWGSRIDASVLAYLPHPRELWASAGAQPRGLLLLLWLALTLLFGRLAWRWLGPRLTALPPLRPAASLGLAASAALLLIPARGGLQLIPINQSSAFFSPVRFANLGALNVGWNFFDSWRRGLNRRENPYAVLPPDSARALVSRCPPERSEGSDPGKDPSLRFAQRDSVVLSTPRPNILLIVWESLPASAVERLGGLAGVTPVFDSLARRGLLFERFYAAGDHTEKGLAALLAGAPTIPDVSILRVPSKAAGLPMLTRDLAAAGYQSSFYYGGELGFGNLGSFALEGGVSRVLGKRAFSPASWSSKWGAHDDAVAERLLADLRTARAPFFATWLTLSSHEPFEVPGPARVPGRDAESRFLNSLAYTDRVLGDLLSRAAAEPWWSSTLVVIVADHGKPLPLRDRAAPFKSAQSWYHIPMLWTGGALARHGRVTALGGQTDFAPTLLGRLGLPGGERYAFGRDLFAPGCHGFAFYGFETGFGLVTERGDFVWERERKRVASSRGVVTPADIMLGRALLQLAYQDFLDR